MVDSETLRDQLREFLGEECFLRFFRQVLRDQPDSPRLRYWQDEAWGQFRQQVPLAPIEVDQIRQLFHTCYLHGLPLESQSNWFLVPTFRKSETWHNDLDEQFPFVDHEYQCAECLRLKDEWISCHDTEVMRQRIDVDDLHQALAQSQSSAGVKATKLLEIMLAEMLPGDELWLCEFDTTEDGLYAGFARDGQLKSHIKLPYDLKI